MSSESLPSSQKTVVASKPCWNTVLFQLAEVFLGLVSSSRERQTVISYDRIYRDQHILNAALNLILEPIKIIFQDRMSSLTDDELDSHVRSVTAKYSCFGCRMVWAELHSSEVRIQRWRVRESMHRADPWGLALLGIFTTKAEQCARTKCFVAFRREFETEERGIYE